MGRGPEVSAHVGADTAAGVFTPHSVGGAALEAVDQRGNRQTPSPFRRPSTPANCRCTLSAASPERAASPNRLPRRARLALSSLTTAVPFAPTRREEPRERRPRWTRK
jgi:hypothetical protein